MMYLYIKTHNKTGLRYLGKTVADPFKYKGSGKIWKEHIKKHGYDVTTEILLATESKEELRLTGIFFSELFDVVKSRLWANLTTEEGQGGNTWDKHGRFVSDATKVKMSMAQKGIKKSESTRQKMSRKKSEEHKLRIGMSNRGKIRPTCVCPHCLKEVADITFNRWHGDRCKSLDP